MCVPEPSHGGHGFVHQRGREVIDRPDLGVAAIVSSLNDTEPPGQCAVPQ